MLSYSGRMFSLSLGDTSGIDKHRRSVHDHQSVNGDLLKTTWGPAVHTKPVPSESVFSDDEQHDHDDDTIVRRSVGTLALDREYDESHIRKTSYPGLGGTTILSRRDPSGGLKSNH